MRPARLAAAPNRHLALLDAVMDRQASLVSRWMMVGFIHGVMNTDNMAISGETIDFGPCAFMDSYDPMTVFSSIDEMGRYAYANQAPVAQWNLARFAETLLPLIDADREKAITVATERVEGFTELFKHHWLRGMRAKLGLVAAEDGDEALVQDLLDQMQASRADFTLSFRQLCELAEGIETGRLRGQFMDLVRFDNWISRWIARLNRLDETDCRTISIESGIHNTALGLILIFQFFNGIGGMAVIAAWWGIWDLIAVFGLASWWRKKTVTI